MADTLYYVHDPMCSWCWGFSQTWNTIRDNLPQQVATQFVLGGLAPDSNEPMPPTMQHYLQQTWQQIEHAIPGTQFNHEFWSTNTPRRSTYPSCRAVLAAKAQNKQFEVPMIQAIQRAYYQEAKNPSDDTTLIKIANHVGCDEDHFSQALNSEQTKQALSSQIQFARALGAQGFPSLVLETESGRKLPINFDYNDPSVALNNITDALISESHQ